MAGGGRRGDFSNMSPGPKTRAHGVARQPGPCCLPAVPPSRTPKSSGASTILPTRAAEPVAGSWSHRRAAHPDIPARQTHRPNGVLPRCGMSSRHRGCRASRCSSGRVLRAVALEEQLAAQRALSEYRIRVLVVSGWSARDITRFLQPDDPAAKQAAAIEDLNGHPRPSMNHSPWAGTIAETAVPGAVKDDRVMNSKAAQAVRRNQSAQRAEAGVCTIRFRPIYAMTDEALSKLRERGPRCARAPATRSRGLQGSTRLCHRYRRVRLDGSSRRGRTQTRPQREPRAAG
jgi:hypothetical protein